MQPENNIEELIVAVRRLNHRLEKREILDIVLNECSKMPAIPLSVYSADIGVLEATVKFLKEDCGLTYSEISRLIKRDQRTVWVSYSKARKKKPERFEYNMNDISMPVEKLQGKAPLKAVCTYLRSIGLRPGTIARLIKRDPKNIWAALQ